MKCLPAVFVRWINSQDKYLNVAETIAWRYGKKPLFESLDLQWLL